MGRIHLQLWIGGYREIPLVGTLFLLNAIGSGLLVAALAAVPARLRSTATAVIAVFTAGTLAGLIVSLTVGLLGVHESPDSPGAHHPHRRVSRGAGAHSYHHPLRSAGPLSS